MEIRQGELFWIEIGEPKGSAPGYRRPYVVIQNNVMNRSRIQTVIVCALTTNLKWSAAPGNVLLNKQEANLQKKSVINVSQLLTVDKESLVERIGSLSKERFNQVLQGITLLLEPGEL